MIATQLNLVALLVASVLLSCDGGTRCKQASDCVTSQAAKDVGRCAPKDFACIDETCQVSCGTLCSTARLDINSCEGGRICSATATARAEPPFCRSSPIACETVGDCPSYLPSASGAWTCAEGYCSFPGFQYRSP